MACLLAKPAVDGLEHGIGGRADCAQVNVDSDGGRELAQRYQIDRVPAYLVLGPRGDLRYRQEGGRPDRTAIEAAVAAR